MALVGNMFFMLLVYVSRNIFNKLFGLFSDIDVPTLRMELNSGMRLARPLYCPHDVWDLIQNCWFADPEERPSFRTLKLLLYQNSHYPKNMKDQDQINESENAFDTGTIYKNIVADKTMLDQYKTICQHNRNYLELRNDCYGMDNGPETSARTYSKERKNEAAHEIIEEKIYKPSPEAAFSESNSVERAHMMGRANRHNKQLSAESYIELEDLMSDYDSNKTPPCSEEDDTTFIGIETHIYTIKLNDEMIEKIVVPIDSLESSPHNKILSVELKMKAADKLSVKNALRVKPLLKRRKMEQNL